ncbi:PAS domain-containing protein [Methylomonas koyamae]|uniref:PAS domain-containing protein n=1 Tax=Methylomonas koyamae TaxID=702114 RepID=UPI000B2E1EB8|nr:PAS domain-containing protein [Methylomonas koyamae]
MDSNLKLTRFTPEASKIFRIREGDIGRPIDDFTHQMEYPEFLADLHRVMETAQVCEREVKTWIIIGIWCVPCLISISPATFPGRW